ncbi:glutathione S-transferase C-terminal domain-containing protein [Kiloniella antarctica]|uniref:Glutathione S-transferase C-terminal domain-containing protein n=1 Tax=Kiloniella antarctica TaxID=1550907 RepID=A0ABW5BM25_9PROT
MGMLINGKWSDEDRIIVNDSYVRQTSVFSQTISDETINKIIEFPDRYVLIGSNSCQWSHRVMICRELKGLNEYIPLHIAHGPRNQGYAVNGGAHWRVPGSTINIRHLHQLYSHSDVTFTGRSTVPILWDSFDQKVISNESAQIMKAFDKAGDQINERTISATKTSVTLYPPNLKESMSLLDDNIYNGLSNGVYKAGFAQSQEAYNQAVIQVFNTLDDLEARLSKTRYLFGSSITASDLKLFTTLLRFDLVYYTLHRCSKKRIVDYPNLWGYARDLYAQERISFTVDFETILQTSFQNDTVNNPYNITPISPEMNWELPHNRAHLN